MHIGQPNLTTAVKIIKWLKIFTIKIHKDLIILLNFFKEQKNIFKYSNINCYLCLLQSISEMILNVSFGCITQ